MAITTAIGRAVQNTPQAVCPAKLSCTEVFSCFGEDTAMRRLTDLFGGIQNYCELPILPWRSDFLLGKNAIYIDPKYFGGSFSMRGETPEGLPFATTQDEGEGILDSYKGAGIWETVKDKTIQITTLFPQGTSLMCTNHTKWQIGDFWGTLRVRPYTINQINRPIFPKDYRHIYSDPSYSTASRDRLLREALGMR